MSLSVDGVAFGYDSADVLRGVSVVVPRGGVTGIIGPNGSGKTTLLRLLGGLLAPSRGRVTLDGRDLREYPRAALARRMAVVPQETHLAFDYTVIEVVLMGRYPHLGAFGVEGPSDLAIARQTLAATGTAALEGRPFSTLSGGEKQRVVIAGALAQLAGSGPAGGQTLLLDEPTASLDLAYQLEIAQLVRARATEGLTVVISTHDLNLAARVCDRLVLLRDGQVMGDGPLHDVLTEEAVRALYGVDTQVMASTRNGGVYVVPLGRTG